MRHLTFFSRVELSRVNIACLGSRRRITYSKAQKNMWRERGVRLIGKRQRILAMHIYFVSHGLSHDRLGLTAKVQPTKTVKRHGVESGECSKFTGTCIESWDRESRTFFTLVSGGGQGHFTPVIWETSVGGRKNMTKISKKNRPKTDHKIPKKQTLTDHFT